ncbi:PREDICTED: protein FAR1-RELATED SEQUENCE 5-like [Prunus mume]|nr:PREDICTED: protein FAR1-RELATED SEQUENCE 5-like [Prunus mume]
MQKKLVPEIGMEFETEEEAFKFYNAYAYGVGFSIRRSKFHKEKCGKLRDRLFVCSAEGKREKNKCDGSVKSHRAETRFGCLARMKISCRLNDKYCVTEFVPEHTHVTSSPCKTHFFRSHRNMSLAQIVEADMADSSGIAPKATLELLSRQAGGRQNLGFIPVDYKNYLRSKRTREMRVGDTGGLLEYLQQMQLNDPNFFYAIQVDEDDMITNIFWADARMMVDYDYFGDVVCFDTTYRKNKEGRPFAMFVGVNNHRQTVVFGAALLYAETADTFIWLFDTFVKAMSGKKPISILTDQDAAMAKALLSEWPETCHRLCIWHIYQNAAKHLSNAFEKFKNFTKDFGRCIYDYEDEDDFINAWNNMLEKYNLKDNDWLRRLFNIKEQWALVYGRQTFCADITTTQRSESMNSALKKYVSYKYDLLRFFQHFQRLVEDRRYQELKAEFRASQSSPALSFPVEILKHASNIYTPEVFKLFQDELCKAHDCVLKFNGEIGSISKYEVIPHKKYWHHTVTFDSIDNTVLCSCKKYEFAGILCAHALKVLSTRNIKNIPAQYILKRWTKNIKAKSTKSTCNVSSENDSKVEIVRRYRELCRLHTQLATRASESKDAYETAILGLNNTLRDVDACLKKKASQEPTQVISKTTSASKLNEYICIDDDIIKVRGIKTKTKVVGNSKRPKNALEKLTKKKKPRNKEECALLEQVF